MDDAWDEKAVFLAAIELPPERRAEFLRQACPDDARRELVENLIRQHEANEQEEILEAGLPLLEDLATEGEQESLDASEATQTSPEYPPIDRFQRILKLGEGGWGKVYLAKDTKLGRRVAIKVLKPELSSSVDALERFHNEARAAAALNHPGIVPVFELGTSAEGHYIVTQFVDGPTLAKFIERQSKERDTGGQTLSSRDYCRFVAEVIAGVADALEAAHRAKIIHRDVKPANIILEDGERPILTDFGIAKQLGEGGSAADTRPLATYEYMSPEQAQQISARAVAIDHRSDVFSLGVVMYEMLALERPFRGRGMEMVRDVLEVEPIRLRRRDARVPKDLETICHKCLEKEPARRYPSAAHLAADLRAFLTNQPILASPPGIVRRAWLFVRQRRLSLTLVAAFALSVIVFVLYRQLQSARDERSAWLMIESTVPGLMASIQSVDPGTLELGVSREIGPLPIALYAVSPGNHRVTVQTTGSDPRSFVEFNVLSFDTGKSRFTSLTVHSESDKSTFSGGERCLHGFLRSNTEQRSRGMVRIPGGLFWVGQSDGQGRPITRRRQVRLASFFIDAREVSNAEFGEFLAATQYPAPSNWSTISADSAMSDRPACVSFQDAEAYSRWRGKRLPSAFEWQAAARGPSGNLYPWGNSFRDCPANIPIPPASDLQTTFDPAKLLQRYRDHMVAVDSLDAMATESGISHLFGNAREFTGTADVAGREVYICGRGWAESAEEMTLANSATYLLGRWSLAIGFRCAMSERPPNQ